MNVVPVTEEDQPELIVVGLNQIGIQKGATVNFSADGRAMVRNAARDQHQMVYDRPATVDGVQIDVYESLEEWTRDR